MMNDKKRKKVVILIYPETKLSGIFTKINEDSRKRKKKNESCTESAACNSCSCLIQSRRVFVSTNHGTSFSTFVVYNIEDLTTKANSHTSPPPTMHGNMHTSLAYIWVV